MSTAAYRRGFEINTKGGFRRFRIDQICIRKSDRFNAGNLERMARLAAHPNYLVPIGNQGNIVMFHQLDQLLFARPSLNRPLRLCFRVLPYRAYIYTQVMSRLGACICCASRSNVQFWPNLSSWRVLSLWYWPAENCREAKQKEKN